MSTFVTFPSNLAPVIPAFTGYGSKIEVPDIQVVFWGPYWPGTGQLTVSSLMGAVSTIVNGPYLDGLKQYGYTGTVNLRQPPIVNTGNPNYTLPPPGPNVDQSVATGNAVRNLVNVLTQNNSLGSTAGKHDIVVVVFVDPSFPFPNIYDGAGNLTTTVLGAHSAYIYSQPLQPSLRFCFAWIGTQAAAGLSAFDQATMTFSHELAEAISNPYPTASGPPTGLVQTSPAAGPNAGEIGDICNNTFCVMDSIVVQPYWGVQQGACILPTETRSLTLNLPVTKRIPTDGPTQHAIVDLGPLCGKATCDYVERTWDNVVSVTAVHPGYQVPVLKWWINGTPIASGSSTMVVPCTWKTPTSPNLGAIKNTPDGGVIRLPHAEAAVEHGAVAGRAGIPITQLPGPKPVIGEGGGVIAAPGHPVFGGGGPMHNPFGDDLHPTTATLRLAVIGSLLTIECGPNQGNVSLAVKCDAVEHWDSNPATTVTTKTTTSAIVNMDNQDIVWGSAYTQAVNDCWKKTHKGVGPGIPVKPINPGDPGPDGSVFEVGQAQKAGQIKKQ